MEKHLNLIYSKENEMSVVMSLPHANSLAEELLVFLKSKYPGFSFESAGQIRRQCDTISSLVIVSTLTEFPDISDFNFPNAFRSFTYQNDDQGVKVKELSKQSIIPIYFVLSRDNEFIYRVWESTGSLDHVTMVATKLNGNRTFQNEQAIYSASEDYQYQLPIHRESEHERIHINEKTLVSLSDIKGLIHNHTTFSDGQNTLEEMALYTRDVLGLDYIAICDHSISTVPEMTKENILKQHKEIDNLNIRLSPFHILKGIEVDILEDGTLDYDDKFLEKFDIVVASIHRGFDMTKEQATLRICKAIENKYVNIIGHPQNRKIGDFKNSYDVDFETIIKHCKKHNVAIELNANPIRLDINWRWINRIMEEGIYISINPDAHSTDDLESIKWGVVSAQKGGCVKSIVLNAQSKEDVMKFKAHGYNL